MCQVQRNRLVLNWRKRGIEYPRFSVVWERFREAWAAWEVFLNSADVAPCEPRLWEVTYVNRIPQGKLWGSVSDWPNVFPGLWGGKFASIEGAELRGFHGEWVWESRNPPARLYVEPKPGRGMEPPY